MVKSYLKKAKKKEKDEITTRILRILGRPITKFLIRFTNVTPNQVTLFSFLLAIIGAFFLFRGGYKNLVIGSSFALAYMLFDCVDGEIARVKKLGSKLGGWLDGFIGLIVNPLLILALSIGLYTTTSLILGMFAVIAFPMQYLFIYFYKSEIAEKKERLSVPVPSKFDFIRYIYGSALFFPLLFISALLDKAILVLWFYAVIGNLFWMLILFLQYLELRKWGK